MNTKKLLLAAVALAASQAFAQAPLGTVTSVNGVATVTTGTTGTAITTGAPIVHGARVITTSTGSVTFRLANGCTVNVPPGHAVTVLSTLSCDQLTASVRPVQTSVASTTVTTRATVPAGPECGPPNAALMGGLGALALIGIAVGAGEGDDAPLSPR